MKLGMNIRNWGPTASREFLTECAQAADTSSLDGLWFNDHIGFPPVLENNPFGLSADMGKIVDPLAFGSFLAGITSRIMFGTGVLVIPYRPKLLTNKMLTSIQVLSGNRFLLGIGPGYLEEEFRALGVDRSKRGKITDDTLSFLRESAENSTIESNGQPINLEPTLSLPPIYIGGTPAVAIPRTLAYGDGWIPVGIEPAELGEHVRNLNAMGAKQGKSSLETVIMKTLPIENINEAADIAGAYQNAGASHLVHTQGYDSPSHYKEIIEIVDHEIRRQIT